MVEAGAGALAEAAEAGSVEDSEEAGEGEDSEIAEAEASEASGGAVHPSELEVVEARGEDSEEREEVKAALNSTKKI